MTDSSTNFVTSVLVPYSFSRDSDAGKHAYEALCRSMQKKGLRHPYYGTRPAPDPEAQLAFEKYLDRTVYAPKPYKVSLRTSALYRSHWVTTDGLQVHDWFELSPIDSVQQEGYRLFLTPTLLALRENTSYCAHCDRLYGGHSIPAPTNGLCHICATDHLIQEDDWHKLALRPLTTPEDAPPVTLSHQQTRFLKRKQDKVRATTLSLRSARIREQHEQKIRFESLMIDIKCAFLECQVDTDNLYLRDETQATFGIRRPVSASELKRIRHAIDHHPLLRDDLPYLTIKVITHNSELKIR